MVDPEAGAAPEEPTKRAKGRLIIIVIVILALVVTMFVVFLFFRQKPVDESEYDASSGAGSSAILSSDTFMMPIPEPFTVNLPPDGSDLMTVKITLAVEPKEGYKEKHVMEELMPWTPENAGTTKMPLIRERIGIVLASKTKMEYMSDIGLALSAESQIQSKIRNELNRILETAKVVRVIFPSPPLIQ